MKNLLVAIDFSKTTDAVLDQAAALSKALRARLWVLHVSSDETEAMTFAAIQYSSISFDLVDDGITTITPEAIQLADEIDAAETRREHRELQHIVSHLRANGVDVHGVLAEGDPKKRIVEMAEECQADIIVLGSHGHGALHKALLGSVSEAVVRHADRNVLVVPTPPSS